MTREPLAFALTIHLKLRYNIRKMGEGKPKLTEIKFPSLEDNKKKLSWVMKE